MTLEMSKIEPNSRPWTWWIADRCFQAQGKYEEAEELYRQALKIDEKTIGKDHPEYAIQLNNLAGVVKARGRYEEAEELYRQALKISEKTIGKDHPDYAMRLNNLASVIKDQGRYEEAEKRFRQALELSNRILGSDHPQTKTIMENLNGLKKWYHFRVFSDVLYIPGLPTHFVAVFIS